MLEQYKNAIVFAMNSPNTRTFYNLLGNSLLATTTNMFVWFALTFWVFLTTGSVLATSYIAGTFAVANMFSALFFGGIVDSTRKKTAMLYSSLASFLCYGLGTVILISSPAEAFSRVDSPALWGLIITLMIGSVAGNLRTIALSTCVTLLFTEGRDKANGLIGMVNGAGFALTSVVSGLVIGFASIEVALYGAVTGTVLAIIHLLTITLTEPEIIHSETTPKRLDLRGTWRIVYAVPGLLALIFFTTFNNFLGGVFMALMDAYGLSLMSVEGWGIMLSVMSIGFIAGGVLIARFGLGNNPLRRMLLVNVITWTTCIFFVIQPSVILLGIGMLIWMTLIPYIEATEHTVVQKVVPFERQGRVLGFAQSIESGASPVTAFLIGPLAQFFFIPFMTTGAGVALIGDWFGTGPDRGIALVFIVAGLIGLLVTITAFQSQAYKLLSKQFSTT